MQVVHNKVEDKELQFACHMTFVYGLNIQKEMDELWRQLKQISTLMSDTWVVLGDFNTIPSMQDRINGLLMKQSEMKDIQNCIHETGLGQISRKGCTYSWYNKTEAKDRIYSLID